MHPVVERLRSDSETLWGATVLTLLVALVGGSLLLPRLVYDRFVWQYFWGPVQADAQSAVCAVRRGGATEFLYDQQACATAAGPVAYPGYTLVSEIGYVVVLLLALLGLVFLLRRLAIGTSRRLYFALFPFMLFGGALRVVEDANDAVGAAETLISYPWNALIISPVIYFTVFGITLASLLVSVWLVRRGVTDTYEYPLAGLGTLALLGTLGYFALLAVTGTRGVEFHPQVLLVTLTLATATAGATWGLIGRYAPEINAGTGKMGLVMIWGHAVDGAANVIGLDWMVALGAGGNLYPKHPVNRAIVEVTASVEPAWLQDLVGVTWPFLLVKLAAATFIVWIFDEEIFEESPRYAIMLLIAALAVGLGPGTRDMLRATFGV